MSASSSLDTAASKTSMTVPKKTQYGKVPCGVYQGAIVDGKDQALLCEGECGLWLTEAAQASRRVCIKNSQTVMNRLSVSSAPMCN